jgi:DNA polymerase III epsilon subunit-like protein
MLLFLDTETTGKWLFTKVWDHPDQPNLLQLGMMLCLDDEHATQVASLNEIIRPEPDWVWSAEAEAVHRISRERAMAMGQPLEQVINTAINLLDEANDSGMGGRIIAHNIQFDTNVMMRAIALCGRSPIAYSMLRPFCTMHSLTQRMALPGKWPGQPKWPTLDEAYRFAVPEGEPDPEQRHTAMGDLLMCRDIFLAGRQKGWWS